MMGMVVPTLNLPNQRVTFSTQKSHSKLVILSVKGKRGPTNKWNSLKHSQEFFCHDIEKHSTMFNAMAFLTQIFIEVGKPLFEGNGYNNELFYGFEAEAI